MPITAFGALRVIEPLRALHHHLLYAQAAAAAVGAGKIVRVQTQDIPKPDLPSLASVEWQRPEGTTLTLPAQAGERIIINGLHLEDAKEFTLLGDTTIKFGVDKARPDQLEATLLSPKAPAGRYAARVTTNAGLTYTLLDSVEIVDAHGGRPGSDQPELTGQRVLLALGTTFDALSMNPVELYPGQNNVTLCADGRKPTDFFVTGLGGEEVTGFKWSSGTPKSEGRVSEIPLKIKAPDVPTRTPYHLVARATERLVVEAKLLFFVNPKKDAAS